MTMMASFFKSIGDFLRLAWELSPLGVLLLAVGVFLLCRFLAISRKHDEYLLDRKCGRQSFEDWMKERGEA